MDFKRTKAVQKLAINPSDFKKYNLVKVTTILNMRRALLHLFTERQIYDVYNLGGELSEGRDNFYALPKTKDIEQFRQEKVYPWLLL